MGKKLEALAYAGGATIRILLQVMTVASAIGLIIFAAQRFSGGPAPSVPTISQNQPCRDVGQLVALMLLPNGDTDVRTTRGVWQVKGAVQMSMQDPVTFCAYDVAHEQSGLVIAGKIYYLRGAQ